MKRDFHEMAGHESPTGTPWEGWKTHGTFTCNTAQNQAGTHVLPAADFPLYEWMKNHRKRGECWEGAEVQPGPICALLWLRAARHPHRCAAQ